MWQLDQRVSRRCTLRPLKPTEVEDYVAHRLRVAHSPWDVGFTAKATESVYQFSGGIPRKINLLCDRALEIGCDALTPAITHELVLKAAENLELTAAPAKSPRQVSSVTAWGMGVAAGVVAGIGVAFYLLSPIINPERPLVPPVPVDLASVALPQPVDFAAAVTVFGAVPPGPPVSAYSILVATFPEPAASAAAAATLKALDYRVLELAASGASQEVQALIGPYPDLDQARQVEAQPRSRSQFREARIVASPPS